MSRSPTPASERRKLPTAEAPVAPAPKSPPGPRFRVLRQLGRKLLSPFVIGVSIGLAIVAWGVWLLSHLPESRADVVRRKLEQNADFKERVGQVQDFQVDRPTTPPDDSDGIWIYDVEGTRWSGRLTVKHETAEDGSERILWARMQLPSGEIVDLDVEDVETE